MSKNHPNLNTEIENLKVSRRSLYIAAVALVVSTVLSYLASRDSHRALVVDQRPQVFIETSDQQFTPPQQPGDDVYEELKIVNLGKTVALKVHSEFRMTMVPLDQKIDIDHIDAIPVVSKEGTIFPQEPNRKVHVSRRLTVNGKPERFTATPDDFTGLPKFSLVWGTIWYDDGFGVTHWTRYCTAGVPLLAPTAKVTSSVSKQCVDYNDADHEY